MPCAGIILIQHDHDLRTVLVDAKTVVKLAELHRCFDVGSGVLGGNQNLFPLTGVRLDRIEIACGADLRM